MQWQKEGDTKEREKVEEEAKFNNNVKAVIGEKKKRIDGFNLYVQVCATR